MSVEGDGGWGEGLLLEGLPKVLLYLERKPRTGEEGGAKAHVLQKRKKKGKEKGPGIIYDSL